MKLTAILGDAVRVDTWPGARWRVEKPAEGDPPRAYRLVRMDRSQGLKVELAGIAGSRLTVVG